MAWTAAARSVVLMLAYLISAIPVGLLLFKLRGGGDIRRQGSGNIGATNVLRSGGKAAGIATLLLDIGKGSLSVLLARWWIGEPAWEAAAAFAAVLGHCHPIYLGFKGGKGIATGCGAYGTLAPVPMAMALALFLTAFLATRMVSVGSLSAGLALPLLIWWWQPERALLISVGAAAVLVTARHHANIRRILAGREQHIHDA